MIKHRQLLPIISFGMVIASSQIYCCSPLLAGTIKPVLKAIDPSAAKVEEPEPSQPAKASSSSGGNATGTSDNDSSRQPDQDTAKNRPPQYRYQPYQPSFQPPANPAPYQPAYGQYQAGMNQRPPFYPPQQPVYSGSANGGAIAQGSYGNAPQPLQQQGYPSPSPYGAPAYQAPPYAPPQQSNPGQISVNPALNNLVPDFGKPLPQIPPSMAAPMAPGPSFGPYNGQQAPQQPAISPDEMRVAHLEQVAFGSTYPEHEVDDRLEHLEHEVFGRASENDPIPARIARLEAKLGGASAFGRGGGAMPPPMPSPAQAAPRLPAIGPGGISPAGMQTAAQPPNYYNPQQRPSYVYPPQPYGGSVPNDMPMNGNNPAMMPNGMQPNVPMNMQAGMAMNQTGMQPNVPMNMQAGMAMNQTGMQPNVPMNRQPGMTMNQTGMIPNVPTNGQPGIAMNQPGMRPSVPMNRQPAMNRTGMPVTPTQSNRMEQPINGAPTQRRARQPARNGNQLRNPPHQLNNARAAVSEEESAPPAQTSAPENDRSVGDFEVAVQSIPENKSVGDYLPAIQHFTGGTYARWTNFPVRVHLPMSSPDVWKQALDGALHKWDEVIPVMAAPAQEPADVEVAWINHLQPRQLGITNLEIFNGRMRVTVYLLRPTYYPPDISERQLQHVATHELGHALGLFGHSNNAGDIMQALEPAQGRGKVSGSSNISPRDLNTLRKVYESPPLPAGFQSPQPISWSSRVAQQRK